MSDVLFVYVREDMAWAEALADMFDAAGCSVEEGSITETAARDAAAGIVIWSDGAATSPAFVDAAARLMEDGKAVIASLVQAQENWVGNTRVFDLSAWEGDPDDPLIDPLFFAVDHMVITARHSARRRAAASSVPQQARVNQELVESTATPLLAEYAYWHPDVPSEVQARLNDGWLAAVPTEPLAHADRPEAPPMRPPPKRPAPRGAPRASVFAAFVIGALMSGAIMMADIRFQSPPTAPGAGTYAEAEQASRTAPTVTFSEAAARVAPAARQPVRARRRAPAEEPTPPPWTSWDTSNVQHSAELAGAMEAVTVPVSDVVDPPTLPPLQAFSITPVALIEIDPSHLTSTPAIADTPGQAVEH